MLRGIEDDKKRNYVRMTLMDPSIDVDQYVFSSDHQLDILRQFTLLENKSLFSLRGIAVRALQRSSPELSIEEALSKISTYLRRYEKSPFWMESFVKSYGFRMVVSDLCRSSRVMKRMGQEDVRIISQVDGGFPFVFWWRSLLSETCTNHIHFSREKTPIYGITKGDEYYPVVSMAGNIAYITHTTPGVIYPHILKGVPRMPEDDVNSFYSEFKEKTSRPRHMRRVLFIGSMPTNFQYSLPFILHESERYYIYEPYHISYNGGGSLQSFYRDFGKKEDDLFVIGKINNEGDEVLESEIVNNGNIISHLADFTDEYTSFLRAIIDEANSSSLEREKIIKVNSRVERAKIEYARAIENSNA